MGGCPLSYGSTGSPRPGPMAAVQSVPTLRVQNFPIRIQDPRLNGVPGAPPMNTLMLTYMLYAALGLLRPVRGLYGGVPQPVSVSAGYAVQWHTYTFGRRDFDGLPPFLPLTP